MKNWYGEPHRAIEIRSGKCVWYHTSKEAVPIRWVIVLDPLGKFETQAVFSTRTTATPKQIVEWFTKRWQVEVTFEESRRHPGIETRAAMVGESNRAGNPVFDGVVFAHYNGRQRVGEERQTKNQKCGVV